LAPALAAEHCRSPVNQSRQCRCASLDAG
jgi:hypothetical protein